MAIRISTSNLFDAGTARISEASAQLLKTQQQISANRRILTPADDPVAAARALDVTQSQSINAAYANNRNMAKNALSQEEGALQSVTLLLQDMKTTIVQAGNATLDNEQRKYLAADLRGQFDQLLGQANARDGAGNFVFSGFQVQTQPFTLSSVTGLVSYQGDQGQKSLQVGPARELPTGDSGDAVFMRIRNQGFGTAAASTNTGDLAISGFTVSDATAVTGHDYEVVISGVGTAGGPVYSVYDTRLDPGHQGTPAATGAWVSGATITVDGLDFSLSGTTPANGDVFSVKPNGYQDVFTTLDNLIRALETPTGSPASNARLGRAVSAANANFDAALDNVLTARAHVGSRLREIDSLDSAGEDRNIQYQQQLSELQDLDYVKAISDLTMQQTTLDAAQKSFVKMAGMSLFSLL